jgi:hypothetical protein
LTEQRKWGREKRKSSGEIHHGWSRDEDEVGRNGGGARSRTATIHVHPDRADWATRGTARNWPVTGTARPGAKWARASPARQSCRAWADVVARVPARARPGYWLGTAPARDSITLTPAAQISTPHSLARAHGRHSPSPSLPRSLSFSWRLATKPVNPSGLAPVPPLADHRRPPHLARRLAARSSSWARGLVVVGVASSRLLGRRRRIAG